MKIKILYFLFILLCILFTTLFTGQSLFSVNIAESAPVQSIPTSADRNKPADSELEFALMYYYGFGVPVDYAKAAKWFHHAAEQGDAEAQYHLGLMYEEGTGVSQDHAEAAKWWQKAAEQGNVYAQKNLGTLYENGKGVPRNFQSAYIWFSLCAANATGHLQEAAGDQRDKAAEKLSADQLKEAQQFIGKWKPKMEIQD